MPGERVNAGKNRVGRRAKHATVVNDKMVKAALAGDLDEETMTYGLITKSLGHGRMRVVMSDRRESTALIRKTLRQKKATGMGIGDVVILHCPSLTETGAQGEPETFIEGLVDAASASVLRASGAIPGWMGASSAGGPPVIATNEVITGGFEFDPTAPLPLGAPEPESESETDEDETTGATGATRATGATESKAAKKAAAKEAAIAAAIAATKKRSADKADKEDFNIDDI